MSLLPSEPDTSAAEEAEPRVIGVDSEDADDVLSALTSETARSVLSELHDDPAPPAALADRVDTSLQNVQYHLNKLEDAGAIEVIDTIYSEKGREMNVYAPADRPLVIMAGGDDDKSTLRSALSRFLGSLGILGIASLAIQAAVGDGGFLTPTGNRDSAGSESGAAPPAGNDTVTATGTPGAESYRSTDSDGGGMEAADVGSQNATEAPAPTQPETARPEATDGGTFDTATEAARTATETAASGAGDAVAGALSLPPGLLFFVGGVTALAVVAGVWYLTD
ncbi:ArsR/SmtB family transcription factor [Halorientalis regularis]|uniref:Helix-turn-helix domain-containing protein n=1 Tax=Halorientalis regularis TaxID=660518 RepID=A0A1G7KF52_9EURY|nr:helix-turn-helix domain-containing protein [Halorientalis regularis]SDF35863.1 Helix-turn-helix domain-containing protein [Halorientalis regularis]